MTASRVAPCSSPPGGGRGVPPSRRAFLWTDLSQGRLRTSFMSVNLLALAPSPRGGLHSPHLQLRASWRSVVSPASLKGPADAQQRFCTGHRWSWTLGPLRPPLGSRPPCLTAALPGVSPRVASPGWISPSSSFCPFLSQHSSQSDPPSPRSQCLSSAQALPGCHLSG